MRFNPGDGLRIDMVISVHPYLFPWVYTPCGQASVDMVISGTRGFWEQHERLWARASSRGRGKVVTQIALGWDPGSTPTPTSPTRPARFLSCAPSARAPHPDRQLGRYPQRGRESAPPPLHGQLAAAAGVGKLLRAPAERLGNGSFQGTQNALDALTQTHLHGAREVRLESEDQPPSYGKVALMTTGSVSIADTPPPPGNFEASGYGTRGSERQRINGYVSGNAARLATVWSCVPSDDLTYLNARAPLGVPRTGSFIGGVCSAVAVIDAPGAGSARAIVLIILGVLIAITFERLFASLWRRQGSAGAQ